MSERVQLRPRGRVLQVGSRYIAYACRGGVRVEVIDPGIGCTGRVDVSHISIEASIRDLLWLDDCTLAVSADSLQVFIYSTVGLTPDPILTYSIPLQTVIKLLYKPSSNIALGSHLMCCSSSSISLVSLQDYSITCVLKLGMSIKDVFYLSERSLLIAIGSSEIKLYTLEENELEELVSFIDARSFCACCIGYNNSLFSLVGSDSTHVNLLLGSGQTPSTTQIDNYEGFRGGFKSILPGTHIRDALWVESGSEEKPETLLLPGSRAGRQLIVALDNEETMSTKEPPILSKKQTSVLLEFKLGEGSQLQPIETPLDFEMCVDVMCCCGDLEVLAIGVRNTIHFYDTHTSSMAKYSPIHLPETTIARDLSFSGNTLYIYTARRILSDVGKYTLRVSPAREYEINLLRRELVVDSHSAAPIAEASVMDAIDKLTHGFTALMHRMEALESSLSSLHNKVDMVLKN